MNKSFQLEKVCILNKFILMKFVLDINNSHILVYCSIKLITRILWKPRSKRCNSRYPCNVHVNKTSKYHFNSNDLIYILFQNPCAFMNFTFCVCHLICLRSFFKSMLLHVYAVVYELNLKTERT